VVASALRNIIESKVCYFETSGGISYNGSMFSAVANIVRGDGAINQFAGRLIKPTSFRVKFTWSTDQVYNTVRLMVFQWLDASAPTPSGILQSVGSVSAPHSPLNFTNIQKIRVLYDRSYALKVRNTVGLDAKFFDTGFLNPSPIQFNTGSVLQQQYGLYMLAISDDALIAFPNLSLESELLFTDA
jgi:hypothetical protein